jgi:hypothetical protein
MVRHKATGGLGIDMWPSKMKAERLIAEARALHGATAPTGDQLNRSLETETKTSPPNLAPGNSLDKAGDSSFQQRLKVADMQGMTLREFEKRL